MLVFLCLEFLTGSYIVLKGDNRGQRLWAFGRYHHRQRLEVPSDMDMTPQSQLRAPAPSAQLPILTDGETEAESPG